MDRAVLSVVALYGFLLSERSTRTIVRLNEQAARGDDVAASHFTQTRYARALGPRNSDLGMVFYGLLTAASTTGAIRVRAVQRTFLYGSAFSVGLSVYLLWALAVSLRVLCPVCLRGHAVNILTFVMLARLRSASRTGLDSPG